MLQIDSLIQNHKGKIELPLMSSYIREWAQWYKGNVKNFHYYRLYNGETFLNLDIKSMQMAKFIAETWADLLLNEKCDIVIPEKQKEKLDLLYKHTNFWHIANNGLEKSFALGIGALVLTVNSIKVGDKGSIDKSKASLSIDFIDAFKVRPITVRNGIITECGFEYDNSDSQVCILHLIENGNYVIHNYRYDKQSKKTEYYSFNTKNSIPFFQIMKPNIANNLNDELSGTELAISVYANAIDGLKDLDMKYDSYYNEGVLKRTRTYITGDAYRVDIESGQKIKTFNPLDAQFYFAGEDESGNKKVDTQSPMLQYSEQIAGINAQLNYVGMRCGFGKNFFKFDGSNPMTATQVKSENNAMARRITKHEILLENVLYNFTKAVIYASNTFTANPIGEVADEDITVIFDDSVIEDKEAMMLRDRTDVEAGLMSRVEYRIKWYGEDKETAEANVRDYFLNEIIDDYTPGLTRGGITPEQYVNKVYGENVENKEELVAYITNFVNQGNFDDYNEMEFGSEDNE